MGNASESQYATSAGQAGREDADRALFLEHQGQKYRRTSIIFGVVGLFLFGLAAGIVAFIMARKAEDNGVKATAGKVLAVLDVIGGIITMTIIFGAMK